MLLCCIFDCRIPRTKQEIEKDFERRLLSKKMTQHMDSIKPGQNIRITKRTCTRSCGFYNVLPSLAFPVFSVPDKRTLQYMNDATAEVQVDAPAPEHPVEADVTVDEDDDVSKSTHDAEEQVRERQVRGEGRGTNVVDDVIEEVEEEPEVSDVMSEAKEADDGCVEGTIASNVHG